MISQILHQLDKVTELLQHFASSAVTFAASDDSISATSIGTGGAFEVGDHIVVSGSETANNVTHTVTISASGKITCGASAITDDDAGNAVVINQEYQGAWVLVERWAKLTGLFNCTGGSATVYVDQSGDGGTTVDYSSSFSATTAVPLAFSVETVARHARLRIRNNGTDQSVLRGYLYGRAIT